MIDEEEELVECTQWWWLLLRWGGLGKQRIWVLRVQFLDDY